jgi:tetratricopeptide (TPR) repeat protein
MKLERVIGVLGLVACLAGAGCATTQELTRDLPGVKFVKYTMAGAHIEQRASLDRGRTQLRAGEYDSALRSLRQAMWEVEEIEQPALRLEELAEVHRALADAYTGLSKAQWSDEQRALAQALAEYGRRENASASPETALAKARAAYQAAHFREAVTAFGQALVELEGMSPTNARLKSLVDARCHLMLAYFALGRSERAAEEVRRLAALDGATETCRRQAPPPVRTLIGAVEASEARLGKRSVE